MDESDPGAAEAVETGFSLLTECPQVRPGDMRSRARALSARSVAIPPNHAEPGDNVPSFGRSPR